MGLFAIHDGSRGGGAPKFRWGLDPARNYGKGDQFFNGTSCWRIELMLWSQYVSLSIDIEDVYSLYCLIYFTDHMAHTPK